MSNEHFFKQHELPSFRSIQPELFVTELTSQLEISRKAREYLLASEKPLDWSSLFLTLDDIDDAIHKMWTPITHLHGVMEDDVLRKAYNDSLPLLTSYHTELAQDETLYKAIERIQQDNSFNELSSVQQKIVHDALRDFRLAGVALSAEDKITFLSLQQTLSKLMTQFSENLLDATHAYYFHTTNEEELSGLPAQSLQLAKEEAERKGLQGYVITLDAPSYGGAMKFLKNRAIRETLYHAHTTRASELGPNASVYDNGPLIVEILKTRKALAEILGFSTFAEYSLAPKMAKTPEQVLNFLHDLLRLSHKVASNEFKTLLRFAKEKDQIDHLNAWDIGYYTEKLQEATFELNQEELRPYFPVDKVLAGLFKLAEILFGIKIVQDQAIETWHEDAHFFAILDESDTCFAGFYTDLFARPHKREGAWMDDCHTRRLLKDGHIEKPVAYLTCNFMRGVEGKPALLTHDDVITVFHEFGHCLHHLLTKMNYLSVSGIHGVPWDAVEFPSQFMENFCWDKTILRFLSGHYETQAPLPDELFDKLIQTKHFHAGMHMVRQLEFALFDFNLHMRNDVETNEDVIETLNHVRKNTSVYQVPHYNRFQNSFSHIFAGSYAAGYYSYLWANVLAADAFETFEVKGLLDSELGHQFRDAILAVGGSCDPYEAFKQFKGRLPTVDALLRQSGIVV